MLGKKKISIRVRVGSLFDDLLNPGPDPQPYLDWIHNLVLTDLDPQLFWPGPDAQPFIDRIRIHSLVLTGSLSDPDLKHLDPV